MNRRFNGILFFIDMEMEMNEMVNSKKDFYTKEQYAMAKNANIVHYLQSMGYELIKTGGDYKAKAHDSLVIRSNGAWYWNSRDVHGYSPIDLLKHILIEDYGYASTNDALIEAVKRLSGGMGTAFDGIYSTETTQTARKAMAVKREGTLVLPKACDNTAKIFHYLCDVRGLDRLIVEGLMNEGKIYETEDYHNVAFVAYDQDQKPRHAFLRGILAMSEKQFKKDIDFSDKSYSFTIVGNENANKVYCFESAVDAISHASLYKLSGKDWHRDYRISLNGTSFFGLERFLKEHPQVRTIVACLDSDETGQRRSERMKSEFEGRGFVVQRESPWLKDFNEDLVEYLRREREDELEY